MEHFQNLSREQKRAAAAIRGPVLCLAGPGSGKTFTLVQRLLFLIERAGVPPEKILVTTYSKAAALSMQQRFLKEAGRQMPVTFGTFHAICYHILKERYLIRENNLLSYREKRKILLSLLQKKEYGREEEAEELLGCISLRKNGREAEKLPLPAGMEAAEFEKLYLAYQERNRQAGRLDFDDMLLWCLELLEREPAVLQNWQGRFSHLLVDEFQDCNPIQYEVAKKLAYPQNNLFAVGDDDQSIYGFRGASPHIIEEFLQDFPDATVVCLGGNYRSRGEIVEAAGKVIAENVCRMPKHLFAVGNPELLPGTEPVSIKAFADRKAQYAYLSEKLLELHRLLPFEEMAVICRTNRQLQALQPFLKGKNIPCSLPAGVGCLFGHFAVRDILDYLKLSQGEKERACLLHILNKPLRHVGREWLWEEKTDLRMLERELCLAGETREAESIRTLREQLKKMERMSPHLAIRFVRNAIGYEKWLRGKAGEEAQAYEEWKEVLDALEETAVTFDRIGEFLEYAKQEEEREKSRSGKKLQNGVRLLTMHGSKGLEFSYVCLPDLNAGKEDGEEERRLFYVGMTRAKKALELLYLSGTKEHPRQPSRFLKPLLEAEESGTSKESKGY